jgi:uncharacterized protein YdgA (DUF945 family)
MHQSHLKCYTDIIIKDARMKKIILSFIALVLVAFGITPAITGYYFKQNYIAFIHALNTTYATRITILSYNAGWFSSHATLKITAPEANDMTTLTLDESITHGPFIFNQAKHPLTFAMATIQSTVHLSTRMESMLFGAPKPAGVATIYSVMGMDGNLMNDIKAAPITLAVPFFGGQITWQGLHGTAHFRMNNNQIEGLKSDLTFGALTATLPLDQPMTLSLEPISQVADTTRQPIGLWSGSSMLSIPAISLKKGEQVTFGLQQFSNRASTSLSGNSYSVTNNLVIEKMDMPGYSIPLISPFKFLISINQLNAMELANFLKTTQSSQINPVSMDETSKLADAWLPRLLTSASTMSMDLDMNTPLGNMTLRGEAHWPLKTALPRTLEDIQQHAQAKIDIKMAIPLANVIVDQVIDYFAPQFARELPATPPITTPANTAVPNPTPNDMAANKKAFNEKLASMIKTGDLTVNAAIEVMNLYDAQATPSAFAENIKQLGLTPSATTQLTQLYAQLMMTQSITPQPNPQQPSPSQAPQSQEQIAASMRSQFEQWVQQGYFLKDGNDYITTITYDNNKIKMNGRDITIFTNNPVSQP